MLGDLADECFAIRVRHPVFGFDFFLGIESSLETGFELLSLQGVRFVHSKSAAPWSVAIMNLMDVIVNNPAAARNADAIQAVLGAELEVLIAQGHRDEPVRVLEIASGPGQHIEQYAFMLRYCSNIRSS